jgi:hypothetical protein
MSTESTAWHENSEVILPGAFGGCGGGLDLLPPRRKLVIKPNSSLTVQNWIMNPYTTDFGHGQVEFMAKLGLNSPFSSKEKKIESNKLKIEYTKPQGKDKAAYDFMVSNKHIDTEKYIFSPNYMSTALIYNSGSPGGDLVMKTSSRITPQRPMLRIFCTPGQ